MMRHLLLYTTLSLLSLVILASGQENLSELKEEVKNEQVEEAFRISKKGNQEESIKKFLEIISSGKELTIKDSLRVNEALANKLKNIGDYDNAIEYAKRYMQLAAKFNNNSSLNYLHMMVYFNAAEQYDSSIHYMKLGLDQLLSESLPNKGNILSTYNNIGFTFYLNQQLDSAEVYYKKVINYDNIKENYSHVYGLAT